MNPLGPGFDAMVGVRPVTANGGQPTAVPSEPTDSVGSGEQLDPYARLEQMRKQGLGSTPIGPIVAQQIHFGSAPAEVGEQTHAGAPEQSPVVAQPEVVSHPVAEQAQASAQSAVEQPQVLEQTSAVAQPAVEQPQVIEEAQVVSQPAVEQPEVVAQTPVAEPEPRKPIVVREPVSEDMRQMIEDMRRNGADIPEPPGPPQAPPQAEEQTPPPPQPEAPVQTETRDPWATLQEMQSHGMGSTPVSGYAAQQLGLDQAPPAPPEQAQPSTPVETQQPPAPPEQAQPSTPVETQQQAEPPTPAETQQPPAPPQAPPTPAQEERQIPRPLKQPVTDDMAQMLEDMRNAGVLPPEETPSAASAGQSVEAAPEPAPPPPTPPAKDAWQRMEEMRQQGLGATRVGDFVRQQLDLDKFDQEHPKPPPQDFEIAPPTKPEPVIQPGGQNRVFDDFQLPPPPQPKSDWWGNWGDFQPGTQPGQPQPTPNQQVPGTPPPVNGANPPQSPQGPQPQPFQPTPPPQQQAPVSQEGWWGSWGDFGSAPAQPQQQPNGASQPFVPGPQPQSGPQPQPFTPNSGSQPPMGDTWWGKWGDFTANPAPTPPVQPQQSWAPPQQTQYGVHNAYYDPRQQMDPRYFDPRNQGYYQPQPVQFPYQPHPGNMPPQMGGGIDPMMLMGMPSPGQMLSPMFSPMMSMLPMIQMMPMMSMMMMPLMTMPFMFGGFGF